LSNSDLKVSIYTVYFSETAIFENEVFKPIQAGRVNSLITLDMIGDDTGDNISHLNASFCEMTAVYWAWKNDKDSDYIGLCHYRRLFSFGNSRNKKVDIHGYIYAERIDENFERAFGLEAASIKQAVEGYDIILPHYLDFKDMDETSVRSQYEGATGHFKAHLNLTRRAIQNLCPEDVKLFDKVMDESLFYSTNMFVMSRSVFEQYCSWVFPILLWLEERIDVNGLNAVERRVIGYIAERLMNVFITKIRLTNPELRIKEADRVFVKNPAPKPIEPPLPSTDLPVITVVVATDENYAPHMAALAQSITENTDSKNWVDLIVLCDSMTTHTQVNIQKIANNFHNMSISLVDMTGEYTKAEVYGYFSRATFYRFDIAEILKNRHRCIFIDVDGIILGDISQLWNMNLEGNIVAAVHDPIMEAFHNMKIPVMRECGDMNAAYYCANYLGMKDRANQYFQAGLIVMDLEMMRNANLKTTMEEDILSRKYWFLDQDVLNRHLVGKVKFLDQSWNVVFMDDHHLSYLSNKRQAELLLSQSNPKFIHFAGHQKPWTNVGHPREDLYWKYLKKTPFYEQILFSKLRSILPPPCNQPPLPPQKSLPSRMIKKIRERLRKYRRSIKKRIYLFKF
jgi:lipopolysaccharide biosynthesis glycosyltransferase